MQLLPLGAILGPIIFTLTWFILGFISTGYTIYNVRIEPYSVITQPISGLGMGSTALFMNSSFILSGILLLIGIIGIFHSLRGIGQTLMRRLCMILFILSPIGLVICGIFNLEATFMHSIGFLLSTGTTILSFLTAGLYLRQIPGWKTLGKGLLIGSPLTLILFILFFLNFDPIASGEGRGIAGIYSRLLAIEVLIWFVIMGWLSFKRAHHTRS